MIDPRIYPTLYASVVGARGSAITGRASLRADTTYPCTLDVVLVTFQDTLAERPMSRRDCGSSTTPYHEHDLLNRTSDDG